MLNRSLVYYHYCCHHHYYHHQWQALSTISSDARQKIGRNSQRLIYDTRNFLDGSHTPDYSTEIFDTSVELKIQNHPEETLLSANGLKSYRRTMQALRWLLRCRYALQYRDLRIHVLRMPDEDSERMIMKLKWRLEGIPRQYFKPVHQTTPAMNNILLSGYSIFLFDVRTGLVRQHLVDRLVPPATRKSLLWRYLERFHWTPLDTPKPVVGTNQDSNQK